MNIQLEVARLTDELNEAIAQLDTMPRQILEQAQKENFRQEIKNLEGLLKNKEFEYESEAGMEVDDNGKKLYTNQVQRQARAAELCQNDADYKQAEKMLAQMEVDKINYYADLDGMRNAFTACRARVSALQEQLRIAGVVLEHGLQMERLKFDKATIEYRVDMTTNKISERIADAIVKGITHE